MDRQQRTCRRRHQLGALAALLSLALSVVSAAPAAAQRQAGSAMANGDKLVQLDFDDVELAAVIETIAQLTNKNFIYDDRVRGRVTIVSPSQVTVEQAYAVFESVLQVKGFTTVPGPGGVIKVIPVREAKESSIETVHEGAPRPNRDHFVTRLIPLRYIDATDISNTLKPLVSKDAALVSYPPTNTIILTDSASNIRRLLSILESIDVASYREELEVIKIEHADASVLGEQISEIYGAEISTTGGAPTPRRTRRARSSADAAQTNPQLAPGIRVRIITDTRTNSLLVLAPRAQIADVRRLVEQLDVPVEGSGRIHVHYLKHADAEELSQTLNALLTGQRAGPSPGVSGAAGQPGAGAQLRSAVTELAEGITLTADPGTNSLVIQASKEAYSTLKKVIEKLDIQRPQVLVEALIMEVDVTDGLELGFGAVVERLRKDGGYRVENLTSDVVKGALSGAAGSILPVGTEPLSVNLAGKTGGTTIETILHASATDNKTNVISAPHILTSDNEEAEIRIGNNIPIITSRLDGATGGSEGLSTSVNVERQDIGVTLRVTPQISEGDTLRLKIFQELSDVNEGLTEEITSESGPALTNTRIENTLVVSDGETVVIGGLISDNVQDTVTKIPWFGDIPYLGWAFKTTSTSTTKQNLLVFLTPHIVRSREDLERITIDRREQFGQAAGDDLALEGNEREAAEEQGIALAKLRGHNPVRGALVDHRDQYPVESYRQLGQDRVSRRELGPPSTAAPEVRYRLQAGVFASELDATESLTRVLESGHDASLVTTQVNGKLIYEIHVGPFGELDDARAARALLRGSLGVESSVMVLGEE